MGGGDFTILREHAAFAWQRNTVARGRGSGGGREAARLYGTTQTWPAPRFSSRGELRVMLSRTPL